MTRPEWHEQAACAVYVQLGEDFWVSGPAEHAASARRRIRFAKQVCAECPVRAQCAEAGRELDDPWAIYGGLTPAERGVSPFKALPAKEGTLA